MYKKLSEVDKDKIEPWIFIGEPAGFYPIMHIRKWSDIVMDIELKSPQYYNIR